MRHKYLFFGGLLVACLFGLWYATAMGTGRYLVHTNDHDFLTDRFVEKDGCIDFVSGFHDRHICGVYSVTDYKH